MISCGNTNEPKPPSSSPTPGRRNGYYNPTPRPKPNPPPQNPSPAHSGSK